MRKSAFLSTVLGVSVLGACSGGSPSGTGPPRELVPELIGTWDYEFDRGERQAVLEDFAGLVEGADRVVGRLALADDGTWWLGFLFDGELFLLDGVPEGDAGVYTVSGDLLTTEGAHGEALVTYSWDLQDARLTLAPVEECALVADEEVGCTREKTEMDPLMRLVTEQTFERSGDDVTY